MNWKEFLKSTKQKLLLCFVLIGIVLVLQYSINPAKTALRVSTIEKISSNFFPYNYLLGQFYACGNVPFVETCFDWKGLSSYGGVDITTIHFLILFVLFLATYYLLSCAIVYVRNKTKK